MQTELKKSKNYFMARIPNSMVENWNLILKSDMNNRVFVPLLS